MINTDKKGSQVPIPPEDGRTGLGMLEASDLMLTDLMLELVEMNSSQSIQDSDYLFDAAEYESCVKRVLEEVGLSAEAISYFLEHKMYKLNDIQFLKDSVEDIFALVVRAVDGQAPSVNLEGLTIRELIFVEEALSFRLNLLTRLKPE